MKILFITPNFPPSPGGVENYVLNIALGLKRTYNDEIVVVTSHANGKKQIVEDYCGLKVYRLPIMLRISNTPIHPFWFFTLMRIIRAEKPDIINAHQPVPFIGDVAAFLARNIPFVLTYHSGTMHKNKLLADIIIFLYERLILPHTAQKATKIICASNIVSTTMLRKYAFKSTIINPGVDISIFKPDACIQRDENLILFVCRHKNMHKMKGLYALLDAIQAFPEIQLRIVGEKADFADKRIISVGLKQGVDLAKEMQRASLLALPSIAPMEAFPMVLIEAMACQTPVIGAHSGGIPEAIRDGIDGFVVPANDSRALAQAISKILTNKELAARMGKAGEVKVREKLTWDTRVALTREVFEACYLERAAEVKV